MHYDLDPFFSVVEREIMCRNVRDLLNYGVDLTLDTFATAVGALSDMRETRGLDPIDSDKATDNKLALVCSYGSRAIALEVLKELKYENKFKLRHQTFLGSDAWLVTDGIHLVYSEGA
jgi:rhodanese-related sulfurtransferase